MCVEVMSHVWKTSTEKGSALLLLLAIADNTNDDGFAYPSVETLAQKTRTKIRSVQRMLDYLESVGALVIFNRVDPKHTERHYSNVYKIPVPGKENALPPHVWGLLKPRMTTRTSDAHVITPPIEGERNSPLASGGSDAHVIGVVTPASSESSLEPSVETEIKDQEIPAPKNGAEPPPENPIEPPSKGFELLRVVKSAEELPSTPISATPPSPRPRNPLFDAVAEHVFGITSVEQLKLMDDDENASPRIGMIVSWLSRKKDRFKLGNSKKLVVVGYISEPAKPEHVKRFMDYYRNGKDREIRDIEKFVERWRAWASQLAKQNAVPIAPSALPPPARQRTPEEIARLREIREQELGKVAS